MSFGSLNDFIILNAFLDEVNMFSFGGLPEEAFSRTIKLISQEFPALDKNDSLRVLNLLMQMYNQGNEEKIELVLTAPPSFNLQAKRTENVVNEMLQSARKSIIMTGYSVSEYIKDFLDVIINKSQKGVFVKLFINKVDEQNAIEKLIAYKGRFLKIYNYLNENDKMAALHAKIISIDNEKTLISSANLSYHGMSANIEMGCAIQSAKIANKLNEVFKSLVFEKVFSEIK